ncbi:ketohexokinase-like [Mercenaria mercenaria]|uniref:ketohexokinase-like n=1 Tax=Mercenaria mercenaria TaxID=6596 RepID=UPI00234F782F|nr:ketohexokinase-like [Mercenaria mercenaria]XP_045173334.2 ketohexokinase-like [Mercenaria mercenaria]XP_053376199.1 ketohexokinase-like [Mercenaria mercenaria]
MATSDGKKIMCVGLCCVDIISVVQSFPVEDTDQRSLDYYWRRGGNAANSTTVLALLGSNVEFMGTLVKSQEYGFLKTDFEAFNVSIGNCAVYDEGNIRCPVAVVIVNKQNGSRTIMAALNNIAELRYEDFERVSLENYRWIHFEGRNNVDTIKQMIQRIVTYNERVPVDEKVRISLELEKTKRTDLIPLMTQPDYVFVSKEFAAAQGYRSKEEAVSGMVHKCKPGGAVICAWGEDGAAAKTTTDDVITSSIFPPENLVDTLGAGDTFNAATIYALSKDRTLQEAVTFGCKIAGAKCGVVGYKGIKGLQTLL